MINEETRNDRLVPLSSMKEYKVAKDNPDVVGWRVVGADGESLGIVKDLIVDPRIMKVRYLSVVADRKFFGTDNDQHMLIPVGVAAIDKSGKKVFVSSIDSRSVGRYPVYHGGPVSEDYEYAVRDNIRQSHRDSIPGTSGEYKEEFDQALNQQHTEHRHISDDFYNDDTFSEDRFYSSDREINEDQTYPTHTAGRAGSATDLRSEGSQLKPVEESIATIERLESLRERGSITEEEFILLKKRALNL